MGSTRNKSAAIWVDIGKLTPWDKNPRRNDHAVAKVAESIKRFGFASPIVAREADGMVIAGHTRLKAAGVLGLETVPVRYMDLDPADAQMLALADNRVGEEAEWDESLLGEIMSALREDGADIAHTAFGQDEVDGLIAMSLQEPALGMDDSPSQGLGTPVIKYQIIFETEDQQQVWYGFLRALKTLSPDLDTVAERLDQHIRALSE